jgi:hypothetical protein
VHIITEERGTGWRQFERATRSGEDSAAVTPETSSPLTMVILAAGMGSRFGGPKQLVGVGPADECILDYNAHDAVVAGFDRLVVVTRPELDAAVRLVLDAGAAQRVPVEIAFQHIPAERPKPWGTAEAVLVALDAAGLDAGDGPFAVDNSDDLYGPRSFSLLADQLRAAPDEGALIGFPLGTTIPPVGAVSRGVVRSADGQVEGITEVHGVSRGDSGALVPPELDPDALCSMNLWGLPSAAVPVIRQFVKTGMATIGDGELLLPNAVQALLDDGLVVRLLRSPEQWAGMTNPEDIDDVRHRATTGWTSPLWG